MTERYRHTQKGYVPAVSLTTGIVLVTYLMSVYGFNWIALAVILILGASLVLFTALTVVIDEEAVEVRFGPGIIRKRFPLREIESCRTVKNPWYYGLGIRLTPHGWLYTVSGSYAVEIRMKNGKKHRIGTDVPKDLEEAIRRSIGGR